jgi:hypothetical protein
LAYGLALTALWALCGLVIIPSVIVSAYHERSLSFLNAMLAGRGVHPVERYLNFWRPIALDLLCLCAALAVAGVAAEIWQGRANNRPAGPAAAARMPIHRFVLANIAIVALLGSFLLVHLSVRWGVGSHEPWPFSTFSMYTHIFRDPFPYFRLYLTTPGSGSERAFLDGAVFYPFDTPRLMENFWVFSADQPRVERLLEYLRRGYNRRVESGELAGPRAECVELYPVELPLRNPVLDPLQNLPPAPMAKACAPAAAP